MIRAKSDESMKKMYDEINKKDLIYCKIDRELMKDIVLKMVEICDYYWDYITYERFKKYNRTAEGINKERQMCERNVLCYRITNNKICSEAASKNTVLSFLASVYAFMKQIEDGEDIFSNSNFGNTIGLCSVFEWNNKRITNKNLIEYYKCLGIKDGQPFSSKMWFFNKPDLIDKINEFLILDIDNILKEKI